MNDVIEIFDGDYKVYFSTVINVYGDKMIINPIAGFELTFLFEEDKNDPATAMQINSDDNSKTIKITLTNFNNVLGTATTNRVKVIDLTAENIGKSLYFSIFSRNLNENTKLRQVSVSFYIKND